MTDYTAEFTGKEIIRAVFTNELHDTINVEYYNGDNKPDGSPVIISMYISSDPNTRYTKALFAEGYDLERVQKETVLYNQQQAFVWKSIIKKAAASEVERVKTQLEEQMNSAISAGIAGTSNLPQVILENNANEEFLFKFKISLFEIPAVKKIRNTKLKQQMRASKTVLDLLTALNQLITPKE